ncbi:N-6 DNA methylase [Cryobacterium zhongshanensis]|uniref:site-specific DNA-methyltransferase (adenine-specific) n=1 Tax=Cryobacterium zhongshanensis TaxID=2928153 RepID=A0AA41UIK2_9MICO|nr:N-6 DNA methylase [Cryobacterium zhongshanensis]MCI4659619.1 N-6 DNA methylase [Cryobacterium zhongshanensis]
MKKLLEANASYGRRRISQVFADFCELSALAIRNSVDHDGWDEREAQYLRVISGYTPEEADRFAHLLAKLSLEFEDDFSDVLGKLYMSLDLGSDHLGQFFTPYEVSSMMAQMTIGNYTEKLEGQEFITVNEPTCGSGGMIVALAAALRGAGVNYQQSMHVVAQDIEATSVHMAYVQLSLLNVPAIVIHGNTLTLEQLDAWPTPAHILGGWDARLRDRAAGVLPTPKPTEASVTSIHSPDIDIEGAA